MLSDGRYGIVAKTEDEHLSEPETTYNLEVADSHTYYVGKNDICVHNACQTSINELNHTNGKNLRNSSFKKLKADINANGIQESVKITEINGAKYIVDGNHRVAIGRQLGMNTVPTELVSLPYKGFATTNDVIIGNIEYLIWQSMGGRW